MRTFLKIMVAAAVFTALFGCAAALAETVHEHWAVCTAPDVCAECGEKNVAMDYISHRFSKTAYDEESHWWICEECGEIDQSPHWAYCDAPNVCGICGAKDVKMQIVYHSCDWEQPKHDGLYHWWICAKCGETVEKSPHWALCDEPDVCAECGAAGVTMDYTAHDCDWENARYDSETHWWACGRCGGKVDQYGHWANCDHPDECAVCGAEHVTMVYIAHSYNAGEVRHDDTSHWSVCARCGEKTDQSEHWALCGAPDVCVVCGAKNVTMEYISHQFELKHDGAYHWQACPVCGEEREKSGHVVICGAPDVCGICGAPYKGEIHHVNQSPDDYYEYNETYHQFECGSCHEMILEKHDFIDGVCQLCGYGQTTARKGDTNGDGAVDGRDLLRLARYLAGNGVTVDKEASDLNGDGKVDGRDVLRLAKQLAGS